MAFSTKITFSPRDNSKKSISFDSVDYGLDPQDPKFPTWHQKSSIDYKSLHFKIVRNYYVDFETEVSLEEFIRFHKAHHIKNAWDHNLVDFLKSKNLEALYKMVHIEVYEWESGFDI